MSSELEQQLEGLFEGPEPDPGAGEEALHRALRALQPVAAPHRGLRAGVLAFAAALVVLVIAAGALAAAGALHVGFGGDAKSRSRTVPLTLPRGAAGIVAVVDGRLSMVTEGGFRLQGLPVSAAALSPHARFVAAGIGNSLVAIAPNGRRAWSHSAHGKIVAIAWAPDGFRIAYVVRAGRRFVLHVIYGNGIHDTTIDRSVRAVTPSWRADNLAVAYVGGGGGPVVYDLAHRTHRVVGTARAVTHVAFAPTGTSLAVATPDAVLLGAKRLMSGEIRALGWLNGRPAAAVSGPAGDGIVLFTSDGASSSTSAANGVVAAVTPKLVVVRRGSQVFAGRTTLLTVPPDATVRDLQIG